MLLQPYVLVAVNANLQGGAQPPPSAVSCSQLSNGVIH